MNIEQLEKLIDIPTIIESTEYEGAYLGCKTFTWEKGEFDKVKALVLKWRENLYNNVNVLDYSVDTRVPYLAQIDVTFKLNEKIK